MTNLMQRIKASGTMIKLMRHQTGHGHMAESRSVHQRSLTTREDGSALETNTIALDGAATTVHDDGQVIQNPHPERAAVANRRPPRGVKRLMGVFRKRLAFVRSVLFPKKTEEQIQEAKDKALKRVIVADAFRAEHVMKNRLRELLFSQRIHDEKGKVRIKDVAFDVIAYDWDPKAHTGGNVIHHHIDARPGRLPAGVYIHDLVSEATLSELQYSLEHPVKGLADVEGGIIKQMRSGNNGLPIFISVADIWASMPKNLPPLSFPVGLGENAQHHYKDLDDCPHLLVIGASKQGKSNMINVILCTYMQRLKPHQVQFVLFDCKNMMEFSFYDEIPYLYQGNVPGIIGELKDAVPAMRGLVQLMNERMVKIRDAGFKNMSDYNNDRRGVNRMPALVVAFDDYIALSLVYGKDADDLLTILSSQARAAGIYLILGAQYPKADRVPSVALINFMVVISFKLKAGASRALLGSEAATDLPCRGRAIFLNDDEEIEVQTPRITDSTIREIVDQARTGVHHKVKFSKIDIEEILAWAIEHNEGYLDVQILFDAFRGQIGLKKLQTLLQRSDEQYFNVNGTLYMVTKRQGWPRRMVLADEQDAAIREEKPEEDAPEPVRGIQINIRKS